MNQFHGIYPALVTPLHPDGSLHIRSLERLIERVYRAGAHGVYLCGSTGEGQLLTAEQRKTIVEVAIQNTPREKQVIVHIGAWSFREAEMLARHAAHAGAAAVSSLHPAGASFRELKAYYRDLAAVAELPFFAYYFPTNSDQLSYEQLLELTDVPNVVGIKFTDYDLFTLSSLVRHGRVIFNGRDEVLAAGLLLGACGGIGSIYNIAPHRFVSIYEGAQAGNWEVARVLQNETNDLIRVLLRFPFLAALKQTLTWDGIPCGPVLKPRLELSPAEAEELRQSLQALPIWAAV